MARPEDLAAGYSEQADLVLLIRKAFMEIGYNYLSAAKKGESDAQLDSWRSKFEETLRQAAIRQKVQVKPGEFGAFAEACLRKLACEYRFDMVSDTQLQKLRQARA